MQLVFLRYIIIIIVVRNIGVVIYTNAKYGISSGPVVYKSVSCFGNEKSLSDCNRYNLPFTCYDTNTIGIKCLECK